MRPVSPVIPGHNAPEQIYAENQPEYESLPAIKNPDGTVLTRWHLTFLERLRVLWSGDIYLWMKTFNRPLQPVLLDVDRPQVDGEVG